MAVTQTVPSAPHEPAVNLEASGRVARRQRLSRASRYVLLGTALLGVSALVVLGIDTVMNGWGRVTPEFFTNYPSRFADQAGLRSSIIGSVWVLSLTMALVVPIGLGTAIWIEEFAPQNAVLGIIKINLANLAGVPSIIYGVLGLAIFVRFLSFGPSILAGALTLFLMILPMTIIAAQEAIRQVPDSIRQGSLALGASQWQTVWGHVLPGAMPGMITGVILAMARAAGETAALVMIGAFAFIAYDNTSIMDNFTVIPVQIYNWTTRPQEGFRADAAAGIIVLMVIVLTFNIGAAVLRERFRRH
ncbi:MAG: phosphate ABC transporter permease PstA [Dehalococcoidia bacterium]|nr:phosphate ABC transporter permease PstA [Dehalococcoidia bacterium]